VTLDNGDGTTVEIVKVTNISGTTLTVTRAQDSTSAAAFSAGAKVELRVTAAVLQDVKDEGPNDAILKVDQSNNRVGILNTSPDVSLDVGSATDSMHIPVGTTAQRPGSPAAGYFRFNSTETQFEGYDGSDWGEIGGDVTYAKIQNVSATDRLLGRDSSGAGVIEEIAPAAIRTMINVADGANAYTHPNHSGEVTSTADGATVIASNVVDEDNLKVSNSPTNGHFLSAQSGNTGGLTWAAAGGSYSDWTVLTTTPTNLAAKGQYVCNDTTARTHTLPAASESGGNQGDTVIIANAGSGLVTIARNSSNIYSAAADGTLPEGNSVQLVYVSDAIGWFEI